MAAIAGCSGIRLALLQATVDECSNPVLGQHPRQLPGTILLGKAEKDARHRRGLLGPHDGGHFGRGHGEDFIPTGRAEEASRLRAKFFFTRKRGASSTFRMKFALPSRLELRKAPRGGGPWLSFFLFQEPCPNLFLSHALPAAGCDSKLSLGSGVQSSELSRQSLAYPGPTEINLAWSVRNRGCPGPARFGNCKRVGDQSL